MITRKTILEIIQATPEGSENREFCMLALKGLDANEMLEALKSAETAIRGLCSNMDVPVSSVHGFDKIISAITRSEGWVS